MVYVYKVECFLAVETSLQGIFCSFMTQEDDSKLHRNNINDATIASIYATW